jgi:UDP-glucuronate 4-epimerase
MRPDYTFVDDTVMSIEKIIDNHSENNLSNDIYNIGSSNPVSILELIENLEKQLNSKAMINYFPQRTEEINTTLRISQNWKKVLVINPALPLITG